MNIEKKKDQDKLLIFVEGRLDTVTAPQLEEDVKSSLEGITVLTVDLSKLDYISSAGLRVMLSMQKRMNEQGSMTVRGVNETVAEIFEVTGFSDILNIE